MCLLWLCTLCNCFQLDFVTFEYLYLKYESQNVLFTLITHHSIFYKGKMIFCGWSGYSFAIGWSSNTAQRAPRAGVVLVVV